MNLPYAESQPQHNHEQCRICDVHYTAETAVLHRHTRRHQILLANYIYQAKAATQYDENYYTFENPANQALIRQLEISYSDWYNVPLGAEDFLNYTYELLYPRLPPPDRMVINRSSDHHPPLPLPVRRVRHPEYADSTTAAPGSVQDYSSIVSSPSSIEDLSDGETTDGEDFSVSEAVSDIFSLQPSPSDEPSIPGNFRFSPYEDYPPPQTPPPRILGGNREPENTPITPLPPAAPRRSPDAPAPDFHTFRDPCPSSPPAGDEKVRNEPFTDWRNSRNPDILPEKVENDDKLFNRTLNITFDDFIKRYHDRSEWLQIYGEKDRMTLDRAEHLWCIGQTGLSDWYVRIIRHDPHEEPYAEHWHYSWSTDEVCSRLISVRRVRVG